MNPIIANLNVMKKQYKFGFIFLTLIMLIFMVITEINIYVGMVNIFFDAGSYLFTCAGVGVIGAIPFVNQFKVMPYLLSLGEGRDNFYKSSIIFNLLIIFLLSFISSFVFGVLKLFPIIHSDVLYYLGTCSKNMILLSAFYLVLYGTCSLIAAIFYKNGIVYGISSIFVILSIPTFFRNEILDYIVWGNTENLYLAFILILIGITFLLLSWLFIKDAEV